VAQLLAASQEGISSMELVILRFFRLSSENDIMNIRDEISIEKFTIMITLQQRLISDLRESEYRH
jgi:hypothetical protein